MYRQYAHKRGACATTHTYIADGGRILGPEGGCLVGGHARGLTRVWSGPYLVLLHSSLTESVILKLRR